MPIFVPWMLLIIFVYGASLLIWASFKQRSRGKVQSSRNLLLMGLVLSSGVVFFAIRLLNKITS